MISAFPQYQSPSPHTNSELPRVGESEKGTHLKSLFREMKEDSTYEKHVKEDGSLPGRIKRRLENVSKEHTSGTFYNAPGTSVGQLECETLGSYELSVTYTATWHAGPWKKSFFTL